MAKKKHEDHENHERWLVSYADFITLLFAFFVVMYSVSSVNEDKYQAVSDSLKAALYPVNSMPVSRLPFTTSDTTPAIVSPDLSGTNEPVMRRVREIMKRIPQISTSERLDVRILEAGHGAVMISLPESILFENGKAYVRPDALPFLRALSEVLIEIDRPIRILGHTDAVPIRMAEFPSNWELSVGRAVMIARIFSELYGVPVTHLSATGFADAKPVASNETHEGRTKNRRVEIVVLEREHSSGLPESFLPGENQAAWPYR